MSLSFKKSKEKKKMVLFDTIEKPPSAFNYGKQGNYMRVNSSVGLYNSQKNVAIFEDTTTTPRVVKSSPAATGTDGTELTEIDIDGKMDEDDDRSVHTYESDNDSTNHDPAKFGTFDGVFGRCVLCMWGVIMFLRTGWIVGNAGIWQATVVMVLSASITLFTTLSLSAICTNGEISHGGPYFLISRSLGPQYGGVIGLLFAIGNCVGVALHLVGFAEAIVSLFPKSLMMGWDIQIIAEIGILVLFVLAIRGVGCIIKFNLILLALMMISIVTFFAGTFMADSSKDKFGFTGYSQKTFASNWNAKYLPGYDFLTMVAIFFPSVTGCMAGANISGDLKNPAVNIPVGTLGAVIFSMIVYIIIAWMLGATVVRELIDDTGHHIENAGLYWNYIIMSDISAFRPLVDMGIYASTFSSATSCFVAAPRIFKAVCDDGLFPIFKFFAVGRKSDNEPVRCYVLVVIICALIMLSGDINFIAPMVTNFFLITYALVNYSVFAWDISKSPGWRPSFKYYSKYVSLFATFQSIILMFLIDWAMALITVIVGAVCYIYIGYRNPETNWGTTVESKLYQQSCKIALKYQKLNTEHAKITRPTFLILLYPKEDIVNEVNALYKLSQYLNYAEGLIFIGNIIQGSLEDMEVAKEYALKRKSYKNYNLSSEILDKCIMETIISDNYENGTKHLLQSAGMGAFKPNVFMIRICVENATLRLTSNNLNNLLLNKQQPVWFTNLRNALLTQLSVIMIPNNFSLEHFDDKLKKNEIDGTIDIWWLFDDGGLTILTGYLLTKNKKFKNYKLRIMALDEVGFEDTTEMVHLMSKLRINAEIKHVQTCTTEDCDNVNPNSSISNINTSNINIIGAHVETKIDDDINDTKNDDDIKNDDNVFNNNNEEIDDDIKNDDENLKRNKISEFAYKKIQKYRKVGKTIERYSKNTKLCLITMPYPRKKYKWWEYSHIIGDLTPKNVPAMFIRGTQEQVLTFCF